MRIKDARSAIGDDYARRTVIYDALLARGEKEPAVVRWGDRMIVGRWVAVLRIRQDADTRTHVLRSSTRAIEVIGEGSTWHEAAVAAGLDDEPPLSKSGEPKGERVGGECEHISAGDGRRCARCGFSRAAIPKWLRPGYRFEIFGQQYEVIAIGSTNAGFGSHFWDYVRTDPETPEGLLKQRIEDQIGRVFPAAMIIGAGVQTQTSNGKDT